MDPHEQFLCEMFGVDSISELILKELNAELPKNWKLIKKVLDHVVKHLGQQPLEKLVAALLYRDQNQSVRELLRELYPGCRQDLIDELPGISIKTFLEFFRIDEAACVGRQNRDLARFLLVATGRGRVSYKRSGERVAKGKRDPRPIVKSSPLGYLALIHAAVYSVEAASSPTMSDEEASCWYTYTFHDFLEKYEEDHGVIRNLLALPDIEEIFERKLNSVESMIDCLNNVVLKPRKKLDPRYFRLTHAAARNVRSALSRRHTLWFCQALCWQLGAIAEITKDPFLKKTCRDNIDNCWPDLYEYWKNDIARHGIQVRIPKRTWLPKPLVVAGKILPKVDHRAAIQVAMKLHYSIEKEDEPATKDECGRTEFVTQLRNFTNFLKEKRLSGQSVDEIVRGATSFTTQYAEQAGVVKELGDNERRGRSQGGRLRPFDRPLSNFWGKPFANHVAKICYEVTKDMPHYRPRNPDALKQDGEVAWLIANLLLYPLKWTTRSTGRSDEYFLNLQKDGGILTSYDADLILRCLRYLSKHEETEYIADIADAVALYKCVHPFN